MKIKLYNRNGKLLYTYNRLYSNVIVSHSQVQGYYNNYPTTLLRFDYAENLAWLSHIIESQRSIDDLVLTFELP